MMIVKNISKLMVTAVIFVGLMAGAFTPRAQSSSCCGIDDNFCCCTLDKEAGNNELVNGFSTRCGCVITERTLPINIELTAQLSIKIQNKIDLIDSRPMRWELSSRYKTSNFINIESVRNSGPPIYLSVSSLLI